MSSYLKNKMLFYSIEMVKNVDEMSIAELEQYLKMRKLAEAKKVEKPKLKVEKVPITQKLSQILSKSGKVITYPKKLVSIAKMRESELDMTTASGKLKLTFGELFEKRLKSMTGKRRQFRLQFMRKFDTVMVLHLNWNQNLRKLMSQSEFPNCLQVICINCSSISFSNKGLQFYRLKPLKKLEPILLLIKSHSSKSIKWVDLNWNHIFWIIKRDSR